MANSKLKLYYFDGKGRAEVARLILAAAGKEYEDIRFPEENWDTATNYKSLAPFGQVPFLEVDGKIYAQSLAIKNFLARELGFYGKTNLESLEIDQIMQLIEDITNALVPALFLGAEEQKKAVEKNKVEVSPKYLGYFERILKENGTGYFVADRITLADIAVFDVVTGMLESSVDVNDNFPLLQKNVSTVRAHKNIGPYIASRPITPW